MNKPRTVKNARYDHTVVGKNVTHMSLQLHNFTVIRLIKNRGRDIHAAKIHAVVFLPPTTQGVRKIKHFNPYRTNVENRVSS